MILLSRAAAVACVTVLSASAALAGKSSLVSKNADGDAGNGSSSPTHLAKNGRLVFFESSSNNLVPGGSGIDRDVFLFDRSKGKVKQVQVGDGKVDPDGDCYVEKVSDDGRFVCFLSHADNVVAGVTDFLQTFVHDRETGKTVLASATTTGVPINASTYNSGMSANGRYVVFTTDASNVVPGVVTGHYQAYIRDLKLQTTELASVRFNGEPSNDDCYRPRVSNNGRFVFFTADSLSLLVPLDSNGETDVFMRDRELGMTLKVSQGTSGEIDDGCHTFEITANGRKMVMVTEGDVTGDGGVYGGVYLRNLTTGAITPVKTEEMNKAAGGVDSNAIAISKTGRYVAFGSYYQSIVMPDPSGSVRDLFLFDAKEQTIEIVSFDKQGEGIDDDVYRPSLTADAKVIAYATEATDLVETPNNGMRQVYVVKR